MGAHKEIHTPHIMSNTTRPQKISQYKNKSHYALGEFRIDITRRSKGDGLYSKRESWSDLVIWSIAQKGTSREATSLKNAAELINSKKIRLS